MHRVKDWVDDPGGIVCFRRGDKEICTRPLFPYLFSELYAINMGCFASGLLFLIGNTSGPLAFLQFQIFIKILASPVDAGCLPRRRFKVIQLVVNSQNNFLQ